jgi:uncharacterized protein
MADKLSDVDKNELLKIAREAINSAVKNQPLKKIDLKTLSNILQDNGASFVTLTVKGKLRGCIGALEAYQPLALDVQEHAVAAALNDFRFNPVSAEEIPVLNIEISWLNKPKPLEYTDSTDLLGKLREGIDGVLIKDGPRRATFLPQVWEQIANGEEFLSHLCMKMGAQPELWRQKHLQVFTYQVEEFKEVW